MRFKRNKGLIVSGTNDWCMVYNYATGEVMTFGEDEIDRVRALVERINRALREGEAQAELEALRWYYEHKRELRERESRKEECLFESEDVEPLIESFLEDISPEIKEVLDVLSPLEKKVFILNKVYLISIRDVERLIGYKVFGKLDRAKKKLKGINLGYTSVLYYERRACKSACIR